MNKTNKIANRVFLAFSSRYKIWQYNFSRFSQTGVVIFKYNYYPYLWAYPIDDDKVKIVYTKDQKDICHHFFKYDLQGSYIDYLHNEMKHYSLTDRNFRVLLFNEILNNGISDNFDFLIDKQETISISQTKQLFTTQYDLRINEFEKVFGQQNDNKIYSYGGFDYYFNGSDFTEQEIKQHTDTIISLLPDNMKNLCYGKVELKKDFQKNADGDYSYSEDIIRTGGSKEKFIKIMIHELAHRWQHKIASANQIKQFKKLYDNCNGKHLKLNKGDTITFINYPQKYCYYGISFGHMILISKSDNKTHYFKLKATRSFDTINGEKIQKYSFPSDYSKTKLHEFISECITYCYCNLSMDENLKKEVKKIVQE